MISTVKRSTWQSSSKFQRYQPLCEQPCEVERETPQCIESNQQPQRMFHGCFGALRSCITCFEDLKLPKRLCCRLSTQTRTEAAQTVHAHSMQAQTTDGAESLTQRVASHLDSVGFVLHPQFKLFLRAKGFVVICWSCEQLNNWSVASMKRAQQRGAAALLWLGCRTRTQPPSSASADPACGFGVQQIEQANPFRCASSQLRQDAPAQQSTHQAPMPVCDTQRNIR